MKRIQYHRYGGPGELRLEDAEKPNPVGRQVRVRVHAASLNPMDAKIRRGELKMLSGFRFPRGLGHDFAGVVEAVGPDAVERKVGEEVLGVTAIGRAGAFAEAVVADERHIALKPPSISFEEAAALTIVGLTAWNALREKAELASGQTLLVTGCRGGVGRAAVQIARERGARIVGTCSASDREDALASGVDEAVDYRAFDPESYRGRFDAVFDTAGALSLGACAAMLTRRGVSLHIVPTAAKAIGCLISRRHHLVFGNPTPSAFVGITNLAGRGVLVPAIGRTVPLGQAIPAIVAQEQTGLPKGKLVVACI